MSITLDNLNCCGVVEISGLHRYAKNPGTVVGGIYKYFHGLDGSEDEPVVDADENVPSNSFPREKSKFPTFFIFTEAADGKYGKDLAAYIRKHALGSVVKTGHEKSSRTGNKVTVYTWTVSHKGVLAWAKKNKGELCTCGALSFGEDE